MYLRCGVIFNNHFIANFLEKLSVESFENLSRSDEDTAISFVSPFLWDTVYYIVLSLAPLNYWQLNTSKHLLCGTFKVRANNVAA